jgi:3-hydroxyisobutyrate dehydrogenase
MAARLLGAGHRVTVYNRTTARAEALTRDGAKLARTPREACRGAEAVFAMTADDASSRALWYGDDGALAAEFAPGALAIECSTLSHDWALELARRATQRGLRYVDAPVTGLPQAAAAGELTLLVGAEGADLVAARPLLDALATRVLHLGPVGAGTAYKLAINLMGAVQIASAAEGLVLAERAGLDLEVVVEAIATSQAASPQVVRNTRRMIEREFARDIVFTTALRLKDIDYGLRLAEKLGVATPFGAAAYEAFRRVVERGGGDEHESRVIDVARSP